MQHERELEDVVAAWRERCDRGVRESPEAVIRRHPELAEELAAAFHALHIADRVLRVDRATHGSRIACFEPPDLRPVDADRYLAFEPIGQGGMGFVYWAIDTDLSREVAFKVVRPGGTGEEAMPADPLQLVPPAAGTPTSEAFATLKHRFLREASVTARLTHPGIVPVYEIGETKGGVPYYTMRFVRGNRSLGTALEDVLHEGLDVRLRLLDPFLRVCDTIQYAHANGIIHRDLKPENVALGEFGEVVVLDWGLARVLAEPDGRCDEWQEHLRTLQTAPTFRTEAGVLGTPGHMAPEVARGDVDAADVRSDVYSLGTILFQILTGHLPYEGENFIGLLEKMATEDPRGAQAIVSAVPSALDQLCRQALARDPDLRPQSAQALATAVRDWQARSASERRVAACLREVRATLRGALRLRGEDRLRQLDEASAPLREVLGAHPNHPQALGCQARFDALREEGIRDRVRGVRRRILAVTVFAALVVTVVGGWYTWSRLARERDVATERLWDSYVAQARASRLTRLPGRRLRSLAAIRAAAEIRPSPLLRDEALSCLSLTDISLRRVLPVREEPDSMVAHDFANERYAWAEGDGTITIRAYDDDRVLLLLAGAGEHVGWTFRFSTDGRYLAAHRGSEDSAILWDAASGVRVFETAHVSYDALAFASDSALVAIGRKDGTVDLHALPEGTHRKTLQLDFEPFTLRFSPDGRRLAATAREGARLDVVDVASGTRTRRYEGAGRYRYVAWSPDGTLLAVGCGSEVHVWAWQAPPTSRPAVTLKGHASVVMYPVFSHSGRLIAAGGWDGDVHLWDPWTGRQILSARLGDWPLAFSPDDSRLGLMRQVWDVVEPTAFWRLPPPRPRELVEGWRPAAIDSRGRFILDWRRTGLLLRHPRTGATLAHLPVDLWHFALHPNGTYLATSGPGGAHRWPIRNVGGECVVGPPVPFACMDGEDVWGLDQSADGTTLAAWLRHRRRAAILRDWAAPELPTPAWIDLPGPWFRALALSPDGGTLATRTRGSTDLRLLDTREGREIRAPLQTNHSDVAPTFSPDGTWLLDRMRQGLRVWRTDDWSITRTLRAPACFGVARFTPSGGCLAVAESGGGIDFLGPHEGEALATLGTGRGDVPQPTAFDASGSLMLCRVGDEGEILVWDLAGLDAELAELDITPSRLPCPKGAAAFADHAVPVRVVLE